MKRILFVLLAAFTVAFGTNAQRLEESEDKTLLAWDSVQMMHDIDKILLQTRADSGSYEKIVLDEDQNGYRWHFFKGKELRLVRSKNMSEEAESEVEWYFYNNQMVYSEQNLYSAGIRKLIQNSKMYLHNENLFYWFSSTQGKIDTASNGFRELAKELKEYSQELKAMYIKR